jgi:hypothetical protein
LPDPGGGGGCRGRRRPRAALQVTGVTQHRPTSAAVLVCAIP